MNKIKKFFKDIGLVNCIVILTGAIFIIFYIRVAVVGSSSTYEPMQDEYTELDERVKPRKPIITEYVAYTKKLTPALYYDTATKIVYYREMYDVTPYISGKGNYCYYDEEADAIRDLNDQSVVHDLSQYRR